MKRIDFEGRTAEIDADGSHMLIADTLKEARRKVTEALRYRRVRAEQDLGPSEGEWIEELWQEMSDGERADHEHLDTSFHDHEMDV